MRLQLLSESPCAIDKGFAIGSGVLAALAMMMSFDSGGARDNAKKYIKFMKPQPVKEFSEER